MSAIYDLKIAKLYIDNVLTDLKENPEQTTLTDLLNACESIDRYYKEGFCAECDVDYGEQEGTTYEHGTEMEFYIESSAWHDISKAIRVLRPPKGKKDE